MTGSARRPRLVRLSTMLLVATAAPAPAAAQIKIGLRTGVIATSNLVRDSVVEPIAVRPNAAVLVGAVIDTRFERRYRIGASLQVARSSVVSHTSRGTTEITTLTIWHPGITLRQEFARWAALEVALGALIYDPERRLGTIFRDGAPVDPVLGIGLSLVRQVSRRISADLGIAYDVHRFTTSALRNVGFDGETTVHRFAVRLTVRGAVSQ